MIYGVAILAACMFCGSLIGNLLGIATGLNSDIGGVGFAMMLLLIVTNSAKITGMLPKNYEKGISFWKEMFIPVVVAMSASQNVVGAMSGGLLALVAGLVAVLFSFVLVGVFSRLLPDPSEKAETEVQK